MANFQKICVFDLETDGSNPDKCSPVQIAAIMIDPISLNIVPDSDFNINLKPEVLENNPDYAYEDSDVLDFHAKVRATSSDKILASWKEYQPQAHGWGLFVKYLEQYHVRHKKKTCFSAPIAAGYNINRFDLRIVERLSTKYNNLNKEGRSDLFYPRDVLDVMNIIFYWFENTQELKNYTLDHLREYLGISGDNAHDALKDVYDTANILIRFLRLHRKLTTKIKFRSAFESSVL
jgi:DNA polymerase III epsilon subunit-like protein